MVLTEDKYLQAFNRVGKKDKQNVFTPPKLISEILSKITFDSNSKILVWYNVEFLLYLSIEIGLSPKNIYIYTNTQDKLILQKQGYNVLFQDEIDLDKLNSYLLEVKFDLVIGNPAWHFLKPGNKKTQSIWHKFVSKSLEIVKDNGYVSLIHPTGWRDVDGDFQETQKEMLKYKIHYLSQHSEQDSQNIFGVQSCFDWYILEKSLSDKEFLTEIKTMDGSVTYQKIRNNKFIVNGDFELINRLIANSDDEKVQMIHSFSDYETRKKWMSKTNDQEFFNPCVSNVNRDGSLTLYYSNTINKGHFGVPKLICGKASSGTNFYTDYNGEYGLTQYAFAIIDKPENLDKIKSALESERFKVFTLSLPRFSKAVNYKMLSYFKKDFWKEFIDE